LKSESASFLGNQEAVDLLLAGILSIRRHHPITEK